MQLQGLHDAAPNLCCVCIDSIKHGEYQGRLFHYYAAKACPFSSGHELVMLVEQLCDQLGYPQAAKRLRSFCDAYPPAEKKEVIRLMSKDELSGQKGQMATFVVHVMHRQNATWQGTVMWAEKNQKANFRSAMELMRLMDSAVESSLPEQDLQECFAEE